jgi:hypothetical protein
MTCSLCLVFGSSFVSAFPVLQADMIDDLLLDRCLRL